MRSAAHCSIRSPNSLYQSLVQFNHYTILVSNQASSPHSEARQAHLSSRPPRLLIAGVNLAILFVAVFERFLAFLHGWLDLLRAALLRHEALWRDGWVWL